MVCAALCGDLYRVCDRHKHDKWNKFVWQVSGRDVNMYLDCLP